MTIRTDCGADPTELENRIVAESERAEEMCQTWTSWAEEVDALPWPEERREAGP